MEFQNLYSILSSDGMKECIQISLLASWCIGAALTAIFYRMGKWKNKRIKQ